MIDIARSYTVEIVSHPKEGAQEFLGNGDVFQELLVAAVQKAGVWGVVADTIQEWDLYKDLNHGDVPYWNTKDYRGPVIKWLYGPVRVKVTFKGTEIDYRHKEWRGASDAYVAPTGWRGK